MFQTFFEVEKKEKRVLFKIKKCNEAFHIMFAVIIYTTCTTLARSHTAAALNNKTKTSSM